MSNLNTVWVVNGERLVPELTSEFVSLTNNAHLDAGIWAKLLAGTKKEKPSDSLSAAVKRRINPQLIQNAMDSVLKSFPNLTVIAGGPLHAVTQSVKTRGVELRDTSRFKVRAVVDESTDEQFTE